MLILKKKVSFFSKIFESSGKKYHIIWNNRWKTLSRLDQLNWFFFYMNFEMNKKRKFLMFILPTFKFLFGTLANDRYYSCLLHGICILKQYIICLIKEWFVHVSFHSILTKYMLTCLLGSLKLSTHFFQHCNYCFYVIY